MANTAILEWEKVVLKDKLDRERFLENTKEKFDKDVYELIEKYRKRKYYLENRINTSTYFDMVDIYNKYFTPLQRKRDLIERGLIEEAEKIALGIYDENAEKKFEEAVRKELGDRKDKYKFPYEMFGCTVYD